MLEQIELSLFGKASSFLREDILGKNIGKSVGVCVGLSAKIKRLFLGNQPIHCLTMRSARFTFIMHHSIEWCN